MEMRALGTTGLTVSAVGLGCNNFGMLDIEASKKVVHRALDAGITLFDTADIYGNRGGSETQLGIILGARRNDIVLATKFGMAMDDAGTKAGAARAYVLKACEDSLRRLRTDVIDLYQLHTPDPKTPIGETLDALDQLVKEGKVRHTGCSNLPGWQVVEAAWTAKAKTVTAFATAQDEYSLVVRQAERELIPVLEKYRMALLPYFPLASGLLTGKYSGGAVSDGTRFAIMKRLADRYMTPANLAIVEKLDAFCKARGRTLLDLAFSWLLSKPVLASVIAGATKPEQIDQNIAAAGWKLTVEELADVDRITQK